MQEQSIDLQQQAIAQHAATHGMQVIRSYADSGRSGLTLKQRAGLKALLQDVAERRDFEVILVYDVSRWGRFQSSDESAYYEFHCNMHGAKVVYVSEPFKNDSSLLGTLVKNMKRAMAGEYSRELSVKVRAGQEKILRDGFSPSHMPHLGYRRQVVSPDPKRCILLEPGDRKAVLSDKIRVVLGPAAEQKLVKRVFKLYANWDEDIKGLADMLNAEGHRMPAGNKFTEPIVRHMLGNEIYIGVAVWGASGGRLILGKQIKTPDAIIRVPGAVPALIDERTFRRVQKRLAMNERSAPQTNEELLADLAAAVAQNGDITSHTLTSHGLSSEATYCRRFGTLGAAYRLVGHVPSRAGTYDRITASLSMEWVSSISRELGEVGAEVWHDKKNRRIEINGWHLRVLVVRPRELKARTVWVVPRFRLRNSDLVLIIRLDANNQKRRLYLLPTECLGTFPATLREEDFGMAKRCVVTDITHLALIKL